MLASRARRRRCWIARSRARLTPDPSGPAASCCLTTRRFVVAEQLAPRGCTRAASTSASAGRPAPDLTTAAALPQRRPAVDRRLPAAAMDPSPTSTVRAAGSVPMRQNASRPPCGCSGRADHSAQLAGMLGLPFAFAHHFSPDNTLLALGLPAATSRRRRPRRAQAMVAAQVPLRRDRRGGRGPSRSLKFVGAACGRPAGAAAEPRMRGARGPTSSARSSPRRIRARRWRSPTACAPA